MRARGMVAQLHLLLLLGSEVILNVEPFADLLGRLALLDVLGNLRPSSWQSCGWRKECAERSCAMDGN